MSSIHAGLYIILDLEKLTDPIRSVRFWALGLPDPVFRSPDPYTSIIKNNVPLKGNQQKKYFFGWCLLKAVVGKMTTFDLWPLPWGGGAWGAGTNV
jgi:hypothetical protein